MENKIINIKKIPKLVGIILLFFAATLLQLIPIELFNLDINKITGTEQLYLTIFSDSILLLILFIIYKKTIVNDLKKIKGNIYNLLDSGIKYWLVGLIVMVISNILIITFIPQAQANNEETVQALIQSSGFLSIIAVGILAPIIEELTFRKAFREVFINKTLYVLASGLIFGGLHVILSLNSLWDLFLIIPYSSLGIAFGYIYQKTDNIYASIIMHMFHNISSTVLALVGGAMILL